LDAETEIGYSRHPLEPLTVVYQNRKVELAPAVYKLFRYVYDLYRTESIDRFDFCDISEAMTGDECEMGRDIITSLVRRINILIRKINSPITVRIKREVLYIRETASLSEQGKLDLAAGEEKANVRGSLSDGGTPKKRRRRRAYAPCGE
jgi:hypothetical protein